MYNLSMVRKSDMRNNWRRDVEQQKFHFELLSFFLIEKDIHHGFD